LLTGRPGIFCERDWDVRFAAVSGVLLALCTSSSMACLLWAIKGDGFAQGGCEAEEAEDCSERRGVWRAAAAAARAVAAAAAAAAGGNHVFKIKSFAY
jgi:hypothetical protein